jgi:selenocysteine lyase/cysteine desulfurase
MKKRQFLQALLTTGAALPVFGATQLTRFATDRPNELAQDDDFWAEIRRGYDLKPDYINLENGYYCIQPQQTLAPYLNHLRAINREGSYYMRTRQFDDKAAVRGQLAQLVGCLPDELIITRNTTESLDTVISGFDWKPGDEAVMAEQDYGSMLDHFKLMARRYSIVNRVVSVPNHPKTDDEIVQLYANAITPKTRLLMVCQMINITGQILPVRKICDMAHAKGISVMVDGAHAVAHIDFKISDLGCDYYGSSLHKWLGAPLGAGMLFVKKEKIASLWPIYGDMSFADTDIRKLNHTGTHPVATDLAIADAIRLHQTIGITHKEARLRYLQQYWTAQVRHVPGIVLNTPAEPARACGIANVGIERLKTSELAKTLLEKYKIWTVAIDYANVRGCRITPNVYTSLAELDSFVSALKELA